MLPKLVKIIRPHLAHISFTIKGVLFGKQLRPCLVHPKFKNFSRFPVTSNLGAHA